MSDGELYAPRVAVGQRWRYRPGFGCMLTGFTGQFVILRPKTLETGVEGWEIRHDDGTVRDIGPRVFAVATRVIDIDARPN